MIISFSGYEGCGKSTLINNLQSTLNFFVLKESGRLLIETGKDFLEDKNDLSYTAMIADMKSLETIHLNNIKNVATDRNLIDALVYLSVYDGQNVDYVGFQKYIDRFCKENKVKNMYDTIVLLKHSENDDHIINNILIDDDRIYGKNPGQYKKEAEVWENKFIEIYNKFNGISKNLKIVKAYPDNKNVLNSIKKIISTKKNIKPS